MSYAKREMVREVLGLAPARARRLSQVQQNVLRTVAESGGVIHGFSFGDRVRVAIGRHDVSATVRRLEQHGLLAYGAVAYRFDRRIPVELTEAGRAWLAANPAP